MNQPPIIDEILAMNMASIHQWIESMNRLAEQNEDKYSHNTFTQKEVELRSLRSKLVEVDEYEECVDFIDKVMDNLESWKENRKWTPIVVPFG